jgi:tetratricopeptide (TPR) repeat protein
MALGVPMIVMIGAGTDYYATSSTEYPITNADYKVGLKTPITNGQEYSKKLELASALAFYSPSTLRLLQSRADQAGLYQLAIRLADQRLFLTPNSKEAKVEKGLALISSLALADQGQVWFEQELRKTPQDGNLWSLKSTLESQTGNMEAALIAANEHVKFHKNEPRAYNMRADIYEKLGMNDATNADCVGASDLKKLAAVK